MHDKSKANTNIIYLLLLFLKILIFKYLYIFRFFFFFLIKIKYLLKFEINYFILIWNADYINFKLFIQLRHVSRHKLKFWGHLSFFKYFE